MLRPGPWYRPFASPAPCNGSATGALHLVAQIEERCRAEHRSNARSLSRDSNKPRDALHLHFKGAIGWPAGTRKACGRGKQQQGAMCERCCHSYADNRLTAWRGKVEHPKSTYNDK